jgi:hypothetical protein
VIGKAVAEARDEISRTDSKAGVLLTLATGALAGTVTFARAGHLPVPAAVALWASSALTGAALALLLSVVRPRLGTTRRGGCFADHERLLSGARLDGWQGDRLRLFSALAVAKHRRIRRAVDLLFTALAALAVGAVILSTGGFQ